VGLDSSVGYTQDALSARIQSSTLNSHRLVIWAQQQYGTEISEKFYDIIQTKHFIHGMSCHLISHF